MGMKVASPHFELVIFRILARRSCGANREVAESLKFSDSSPPSLCAGTEKSDDAWSSFSLLATGPRKTHSTACEGAHASLVAQARHFVGGNMVSVGIQGALVYERTIALVAKGGGKAAKCTVCGLDMRVLRSGLGGPVSAPERVCMIVTRGQRPDRPCHGRSHTIGRLMGVLLVAGEVPGISRHQPMQVTSRKAAILADWCRSATPQVPGLGGRHPG